MYFLFNVTFYCNVEIIHQLLVKINDSNDTSKYLEIITSKLIDKR